jgi:hypothetical protein
MLQMEKTNAPGHMATNKGNEIKPAGEAANLIDN